VRLLVEGLFIKVSGITSEEDALFSIGLGASAVAGLHIAERQRRHRDAQRLIIPNHSLKNLDRLRQVAHAHLLITGRGAQ